MGCTIPGCRAHNPPRWPGVVRALALGHAVVLAAGAAVLARHRLAEVLTSPAPAWTLAVPVAAVLVLAFARRR